MSYKSTASLRFYATPEVLSRAADAVENYALEIRTSPSNAAWVTDGKQTSKDKVLAVHPGALILDAALMGVPDFSEDAGFLSGSASSSEGEYHVSDINYSLTDFIAGRYVNKQALKGATLTLYQCDDEETFTAATIKRTNLGRSYQDAEGSIKLGFEGVHSLVTGTLMEPQVFRLGDTIDDLDDFLPLVFESGIRDPSTEVSLPSFKHNAMYSTDPNVDIGYLISPSNEVVSYKGSSLTRKTVNGRSYWGIQLYKRALFGTLSTVVEVQGDATFANLPTFTEFIYIEERPSDMILLICENETGDGRTGPDHWGIGLPNGTVDIDSLGQGVVGMDTDRMRFDNPASADAKEWLEKKILKDIPAVMVQNVYGQLSLRRRGTMSGSQSASVYLDKDNLRMDISYVMEHPIDSLRNPIIGKRGWDPLAKIYLYADIVYSSDAEARFGKLEPITYEFPSWGASVGSQAQLEQRIRLLRDIHQSEGKKIVVESLPHLDVAQVGDIVHLTLDKTHLTDSSTGISVAAGVDEAFVVIAKGGSSTTGTYKYALFSTTGSAEREGSRAGELSDEEYARMAPTHLKNVIPYTTDPDGRLVFSGAHSIEPDKYYRIEGKARFATDFKLVPSRNCQFLGIAHDELFVASTSAAIDMRGKSVFGGTEDPRGNPGYIGITAGGGGMSVVQFARDNSSHDPQRDGGRITSLPPPVPGRPSITSFDGWALSMYDGQLGNIPTVLAGSGGGGSGEVSIGRQYAPGSTGRFNDGVIPFTRIRASGSRGGASAIYIGKSLSRATTGVYCNVSGALTSVRYASESGSANLYAGPGQPGSAGVAAFIVDGAGFTPTGVDEFGVKAFSGVIDNDASVPVPSVVNGGGWVTPGYRSYYQPTPSINRWQAHSSVMFVPADESRQARPVGAFDVLADLEAGYDGKITLHPVALGSDGLPVWPGNADPNDYAAVESDLLNRNLPPTSVRMWQLNARYVWAPVTFPDVAAEFKIFNFRDRGSVVLFISDARPAIGEYTIGDSWFSQSSRHMYTLGATAAEDILVSADTYSDYSGSSLSADPTFADYLSGKDTLRFAQTLDDPLQLEGQVASTSTSEVLGETSDPYSLLITAAPSYFLQGAVQWAAVSGEIVSSAGSGSGDAVAFYNTAQGFYADDAPRIVWVYSKGTGTIKVQGAGAADNAGTPSQQVSGPVSSTTYSWTKLSGLFGSLHAQAQVRTQNTGLHVSRLLLIDKDSTSVPSGTSGFGAGQSVAVSPRPFWPINVTADRLRPLQRGGSNGPITMGMFGEGGSPGARIDYSGANVPNVMYERFPWKPSPGRQYRMTARVKNVLNSGFSNPLNMGVAIEFEAYNSQGKRVLRTNVLPDYSSASSPDKGPWLSKNSTQWTTLTRLVKLPKDAADVQWAAMKLVVRGDASGQCFVSEMSPEEMPYRFLQYSAASLDFVNLFSTDGQLHQRVPMQVAVDGRKGMGIDMTFMYSAFVDNVDSGSDPTANNLFPSVIIFVRFLYLDADGNPVSVSVPGKILWPARTLFPVNENPRALTYRYSQGGIGTQSKEVVQEQSWVAPYDFTHIQIVVWGKDVTTARATRDLFLRDIELEIKYGDNLVAGNNG